jgi:hypothetical protein
MDDIVRIYKARNVYEAQILCQALEEAGITARTEGGNLTGFAGDASVGALGHVAIVVSEKDEERAKAELGRLLQEHKSDTDPESLDFE